MNNDGDGRWNAVEHAFFLRDLQIRRLKHEQLSPYLQIWVLAMEALCLGFGLAILGIGAVTWLSNGTAAALDAVEAVTRIAVPAAIVLTVFLRVAWLTASGGRSVIGGRD